MSRKYMVLADVDGEIRILRLLSNGPRKGVERLCREMVEKLFANRRVLDLWVGPWPVGAGPQCSAPTGAVLELTGR